MRSEKVSRLSDNARGQPSSLPGFPLIQGPSFRSVGTPTRESKMRVNICPACRSQVGAAVSGNNPWDVKCTRCGKFSVIGSDVPRSLELLDDTDRRAVLTWLDNSIEGAPRLIVQNELNDILRTRVPSPKSCADRLLAKIIARFSTIGRSFEPYSSERTNELYRAAHIFSPEQLTFFLTYLVQLTFLQAMGNGRYAVTPFGYQYAEGLGSSAGQTQAFVAMWFDKLREEVWLDGLKPAIESAGWEALRIDNKEHVNKICDEIIAEIRRSRFLVADLTGSRGGVYYEAGFAQGLGIPVILTCREGDERHFDVRQYNCVLWNSAADARDKLQKRIGAVIGYGPLKSALVK
jgi:hypothetical protein